MELMTPKLIKSKIRTDSAEMMPVVTSWIGVPLIGFMVSKTKRPQQFITAKNVTRMKPANENQNLINFHSQKPLLSSAVLT